jgi:hypothetical protein
LFKYDFCRWFLLGPFAFDDVKSAFDEGDKATSLEKIGEVIALGTAEPACLFTESRDFG